jgi:DNA helicase II / ATP-dependent DNA helicase PcrA
MSWLDELNTSQREAVTTGDGPVLVIAGAGTGKTRTLACRVAWLIERGVQPDRILLLTFTRRAAVEMLSRAARVAGGEASGRVWGGTFHAIANRLLREYGRAAGISPDFSVIDQADAADLINLIRGEMGYGKSEKRFPRKETLISIYSRTVNSRTKLSEVVRKNYPWCMDSIDGIRELLASYGTRKRECNLLDYDDLLLYWLALCGDKHVGRTLSERFDHILVDEYQDTNMVQAEILRGMRISGGNVMVVGDDAQSIYSFRAATVENMLNFPKQFEGARLIRLEENYRSVQPILDASNAIMEQAKSRYAKNLFSVRGEGGKPAIVTCLDETEQCSEVCKRVLEKYEEGVPLMQQAVLFRAGHHSDQLEVELTRRNIPFVKYGGLRFIEAAHVKDMLAVMRLLDNPYDEISWYRVLQLLQGIGPSTARNVMRGLGVIGAREPGDRGPLRKLLEKPPRVPAAAREEFEGFRSAIADCIDEETPSVRIQRIRRFYEPLFQRLYDNPTVRLRDLDQLELIASTYRSSSRFVTELTLDPPRSTQELPGKPMLDEDYLVLSTIHSAKGCEWDTVHVIHAADGMIPSDMCTGDEDEIEEERRLLYVAMTRAKNSLNIFFPLRYYHHRSGLSDSHTYAQLSRFLAGLEADLFHRLRAGAAAQEEERQEADVPETQSLSVHQMLKDLLDG